MNAESATREMICLLGKSLFDRGYTHGSTGNITVRLDDGLLATPTNASLGRLDPARLTRLGADGRLMSGDRPTKEIPLHTALYDSRAGAGAIVHLHSHHAVAWSMLPEVKAEDALPPLTAYSIMRAGKVALVPYFRPGDPAIAAAIQELGGKYGSLLLANHGPVVAGVDLDAAVNAIEELEQTARLALLTRGLNPRLLTEAEIADLASFAS